MRRHVTEMVKPEDREYMQNAWKKGMPEFFAEGLLKQSWKHRVRDGLEWRLYELTILRIDTEHPRQRKALLLWKALENPDGSGESAPSRHADESQILHQILKGISRYRND